MPKKKQPPKIDGKCRDCEHVTIVTRFETLSVEGKPTLGKCPYYNQGCVILSHKACAHYKKRVE